MKETGWAGLSRKVTGDSNWYIMLYLKFFSIIKVLISTFLFAQSVMKDRGSFVNFLMRKALSKIYTWTLCFQNTEHQKVEFNPHIYSLSKLFRFRWEITVLIQNGWHSEQPPAHTPRERFHPRMNVKYCLMFTIAENTGSNSVNIFFIYKWFSDIFSSISKIFCFVWKYHLILTKYSFLFKKWISNIRN